VRQDDGGADLRGRENLGVMDEGDVDGARVRLELHKGRLEEMVGGGMRIVRGIAVVVVLGLMSGVVGLESQVSGDKDSAAQE